MSLADHFWCWSGGGLGRAFLVVVWGWAWQNIFGGVVVGVVGWTAYVWCWCWCAGGFGRSFFVLVWVCALQSIFGVGVGDGLGRAFSSSKSLSK